MHTPEIVRVVSELNEVDKAIQFLYEQCKLLKEECNKLKEENNRLKNNQQSS
jgi:FtsZ-binding cell division protein ZapB